MREYDRNLAVDGASRELGLTVSRVKAQFEELQPGNIKPPKKPSNDVPPRAGQSPSKKDNREKEGVPKFSRIPTNTDSRIIKPLWEEEEF